jgi:hypothetical protein
MFVGREIEEQIQENPKEDVNPASAIGLVLSNYHSTILNDLRTMLKKQQTNSLEGYILCLSRVLNHKLAWHLIDQAYRTVNAPIPRRYYALFGQVEKPKTVRIGPTAG